MNAACRLIGGLRRGYSLAELEVAADRAMKDGVRYAYWLAQPYRRGLSDSRPTIRAYREAYATLKDLPGRARAGQFGAVNRVVQCINQTVAAVELRPPRHRRDASLMARTRLTHWFYTGVVGAWDVYRRYPFTICGGVLIAAAPFLSKGN